MTEQEKRQHRCCFTGHRPEKLAMTEKQVHTAMKEEIQRTIADGFDVFISGMARGIDIIGAEIVLELRKAGEPVRLICASPYQGFEVNWSSEWRSRYEAVLSQADLVRYICPSYSRTCFRIRNEWMVDHSARALAVYNGESGGTKNTIDYAIKQGVPVVIVQCPEKEKGIHFFWKK